jgi:hypothetical protein
MFATQTLGEKFGVGIKVMNIVVIAEAVRGPALVF